MPFGRIAEFASQSPISERALQERRDKRKRTFQNARDVAVGTTLTGTGAALTYRGIASGGTRAVGARLERHATSKENAKKILDGKAYGYLDASRSSIGGGNAQGVIAKQMLDRYDKDPLIKKMTEVGDRIRQAEIFYGGRAGENEFEMITKFLRQSHAGMTERGKGYNFISGRNPAHPNWGERGKHSPLLDVITRKAQVAGYRGIHARPLSDEDFDNVQKLIKSMVDINPKGKQEIVRLWKEQVGDEGAKALEEAILGKTKLSDLVKKYQSQALKELDVMADISKQIARAESPNSSIIDAANEMFGSKLTDSVLNADEIAKSLKRKGYDGVTVELEVKFEPKGVGSRGSEYSPVLVRRFIGLEPVSDNSWLYKRDVVPDEIIPLSSKSFLKDDKLKWTQTLEKFDNARWEKLPELQKKLQGAGATFQSLFIRNTAIPMFSQQMTFYGRMPAGGFGMLSAGKELYVPGTDEFFNNTDKFKFDPDDPYSTPKGFTQGKFLGDGNALKTTDKVKVYNNRFRATYDHLKEVGEGNVLEGAKRLIKANPARAKAGLAILAGGLGLGSLAVAGGLNRFDAVRKRQRMAANDPKQVGKVRVGMYARKTKDGKVSQVRSFLRERPND